MFGKFTLKCALATMSLGAALLASCEQTPTDVSDSRALPMGASKSSANPVFAVNRSVDIKSGGTTKTYAGIAVMDSDGGHLTQVYTVSTSGNVVRGPSWSPNGSSIAWVEVTSDQWVWSVKAIDVSVTSGAVSTSNLRTLYTSSHDDSMRVMSSPSWCSVTSTAKIAIPRQHVWSGYADICTVPAGGGSPTVVYSRTDGYINQHQMLTPTWSSDDSKIAFVDADSANNQTIKAVEVSTGTITDSKPITNMQVARDLEWSRAGQDVVAFTKLDTDGRHAAYWTLSTNAINVTTLAMADNVTWAPTNSYIYYGYNSNLYRALAQGTSGTSLSTTAGAFGQLRRKR